MYRRLIEILHTHRNMILVSLAVAVIVVLSFLLVWVVRSSAGKTPFDYFEALIIPVVLGVIAFLLNWAAKKRALDIESDRQRQETLTKYYDVMTDLLIKHKLKESEEDEPVRTLASARTLSAVRDLNGERRGRVLKFLSDNGVINMKQIIDLKCAIFNDAELRDAHLEYAHLEKVYLKRADLRMAHLEEASLKGANLDGANLTNSEVTPNQLAEAITLKNAIMPDGTKFGDWVLKEQPDWSKGTSRQQADEPEENDSEGEDEA